MNEGRLIYVVGPSGAGKDSVIARARETLNKNSNVYFSHRYVTRPAVDGSNDFALTDKAFEHYQSIGMFALDWEAHGLSYGVGVVIDNQLRAGKTVVVNGSRAYLATAIAKYPRMTVVLITVAPTVARTRLYARGRENDAAIAERLDRAPHIAVAQAQLVTIDNSGPLERATEALVRVLVGDGHQGLRSTHSSLASF